MRRKVNWVALITWIAIAVFTILFWMTLLIPDGTITAQGAGQPCNWNSDCGYNEICVPVKRGWGTPRMCVEKPNE